MKTLSIGVSIKHSEVTNSYFSSSFSFLDYDLVLLDFTNILDEYNSDYSYSTYMGYKCLSDDDSVKISNDIERRKIEIKDMLQKWEELNRFFFYANLLLLCNREKRTFWYWKKPKNYSNSKQARYN